MQLERLKHDPGTLVEFYTGALEYLGALVERTWYDRLQVVAESSAAGLWNAAGSLHETELNFLEANAAGSRDGDRDVFPGSPLTFRLAERLNPQPPTLERLVLAPVPGGSHPPTPEVAERTWRARWPSTRHWQTIGSWRSSHAFSLVAVVRVEIQAIDQHWSAHRLAFSLPSGERDTTLESTSTFDLAGREAAPESWPRAQAASWRAFLEAAMADAIAPSLAVIRARQQRYLEREWSRIDEYFNAYSKELSARRISASLPKPKMTEALRKRGERRAAAEAEHARKREDQLQRHEIRVVPHVDALWMVAEPAWRTEASWVEGHDSARGTALFVPRTRSWNRSA